MRAAVLAALLAAGALTATPAAACSVRSDYVVPSALELAAAADTIVVATITGERRGRDLWNGRVLLRPTVLLKGTAPPAAVELPGTYLARDSSELRAMVEQSDPRELRHANPGAMIGGCNRYVFARDMQLLLFLERAAGGKLTPIRHAFARDAEDVSGPDALWVKAVREYAAISAVPKAAWKPALLSRAAALRATGDPDDAAIAADMIEETVPRRPFTAGRGGR